MLYSTYTTVEMYTEKKHELDDIEEPAIIDNGVINKAETFTHDKCEKEDIEEPTNIQEPWTGRSGSRRPGKTYARSWSIWEEYGVRQWILVKSANEKLCRINNFLEEEAPVHYNDSAISHVHPQLQVSRIHLTKEMYTRCVQKVFEGIGKEETMDGKFHKFMFYNDFKSVQMDADKPDKTFVFNLHAWNKNG